MNKTAIAPKDEPQTTAKVVLITTSGQLQIELWAAETPLASRNFIQLCMDGYYNNTIFHRMIPGFMIQGGDPTGTGTGGESIYGGPFKDQFHQRLRFGRRGMVAMANTGKDSNGTQFFISFAECQQLNKKHTIFGKVVGDSVYNLLSFQSLDTDQNDRPVYPPSIRKVKVVLNPFDDINPRITTKTQQVQNQKPQQSKQNQKKMKKNEIKKLKNKNRLTFEDPQQNDVVYDKIKSSHDTLNDQRLSKQVAVTQQQLQRKRRQKQQEQQKKKQLAKKINEANISGGSNKQDIEGMLKAEILKKKKMGNSENQQVQDQVLNYHRKVNPQTGKMQIIWGDEQKRRQQQQKQKEKERIKLQNLRQLQQRQYQALKADELNFKKLKQGSAKQRRKQLVAEQTTLLSTVQKKRYEFLKKSRTEKKQNEVLSKLNKFTERLKKDNPNDWMCHSLKFHIDSRNAYDLEKKNQQRGLRKEMVNDDEDDGGLKVQFDKYEPQNDQINFDELYELAAKDDSASNN